VYYNDSVSLNEFFIYSVFNTIGGKISSSIRFVELDQIWVGFYTVPNIFAETFLGSFQAGVLNFSYYLYSEYILEFVLSTLYEFNDYRDIDSNVRFCLMQTAGPDLRGEELLTLFGL